MSKTLKIPEGVHRELKIFVATSKENMESFAGFAIMKHLKDRGHNFSIKQSNAKSKK